MKIKERYPFASLAVETLEIDQGKLVLHHKHIGCEYTKEIPLHSINSSCQNIQRGSFHANRWSSSAFWFTIILLILGTLSKTTGDFFSILFVLGCICGFLSLFFRVLGSVKWKAYANFYYESGQHAFSISSDKHADFIQILTEKIEEEKASNKSSDPT